MVEPRRRSADSADAPLVRTQIYLTAHEQEALRALSRKTGVYQSALIRQAVDTYLLSDRELDRGPLIRQARGLWQDRTDLPDFAAIRREVDRV